MNICVMIVINKKHKTIVLSVYDFMLYSFLSHF